MAKNISKIYRRASFIILVIIVSGLLNICLFSLQAKAAAPKPTAPKINFANDNYYGSDETCATEATHEPMQHINRPSAPMPECCLAQNRNFNAVVNAANDKSAPTFSGTIIAQSETTNLNFIPAYYTSQIVFPPPASLALASTIIRE